MEQALLIDDGGDIVPSPLTVGVQLRDYLRVDLEHDPKRPMQAFAEFIIQPRKLMEGSDASMRPVTLDEQHFSATDLSGGDPFVKRGHRALRAGTRLRSCIICHTGWGIHSVNSRAQLFELNNLLPPRFQEGKPSGTANTTAELKRQSYSWGMLEGLSRVQQP